MFKPIRPKLFQNFRIPAIVNVIFRFYFPTKLFRKWKPNKISHIFFQILGKNFLYIRASENEKTLKNKKKLNV